MHDLRYTCVRARGRCCSTDVWVILALVQDRMSRDHRGQGQVQDTMWRPDQAIAQMPFRKVTLHDGVTSKVNVINPSMRKPIHLPGAFGGSEVGRTFNG